jgi:hypothetical protein
MQSSPFRAPMQDLNGRSSNLAQKKVGEEISAADLAQGVGEWQNIQVHIMPCAPGP